MAEVLRAIRAGESEHYKDLQDMIEWIRADETLRRQPWLDILDDLEQRQFALTVSVIDDGDEGLVSGARLDEPVRVSAVSWYGDDDDDDDDGGDDDDPDDDGPDGGGEYIGDERLLQWLKR